MLHAPTTHTRDRQNGYCRHATNAAAPPYVMPEGLQRAAPPPVQLLEVALEAAAAHSRAALQYSAIASNADGIQNRGVALDLQEWAMQVGSVK